MLTPRSVVCRFVPALLAGATLLAGDPGSAWEPVGPYGGSAHVVALDQRKPHVLVAGTRNGLLFRSTDAALHWSPLPLPRFTGVTLHAVVIDPHQPDRLWVGLKDPQGEFGGLWRSDDAGQTWRPIEELRGRGVLSIVARTSEPRWMAAGTDRGVYWAPSSDAAWKLITPPEHPEMNGIVSLEFDEHEPETLFAGTTHLPWKTIDLGKTWSSIHEGMIDDSDVFSIWSDRSTPGRVFASACSGIYASLNGGLKWSKANGIPPDNRRTYIITQDRAYPNLVYAGTTQGLWKSPDGGATWKKLNATPVNWLSIDPRDGRIMYLAVDGGGILKTVDGGRTFVQRTNGMVNRSITSLVPSPQGLFASSMYEGEYGGLFLSSDRGDNWSLVANQTQLKGENLRRLTLSGERLVGLTFSGRMVSRDGGKTWQRMAAGGDTSSARKGKKAAPKKTPVRVALERPLPKIEGVTVYDAIADVKNARQRLAATSAGVYRSRDGGATWAASRKGLPNGFIRSVVYHPKRSGECYAIQYANLYRSRDGGETWEQLSPLSSQPLPLVSLVISPWAENVVFAVSEDRGVWRRRI